MRIDRSHTRWIIFVILATAAAGLLFLANFHPTALPFRLTLPVFFGEVPPTRNTFGGTPLGLIFGSLAFLIFLFASALGIRKKKRLWRIGSVQMWLRAHIWLTLFTVPLVMFHCGFHSGGPHTSWLILLYIFVMASGFFGLALQQFMPRLMKERLPREVIFEQIPHIRGLLFEAALKLRKEIHDLQKATLEKPAVAVPAGVPGTEPAVPANATPALPDASLQIFGEFLDDECLPYLHAQRGDRLHLGDTRTAGDLFRLLKLGIADEWEPKITQLQQWCDDRRLMDLQVKFHHWLHGWLLIHVPTSFALLIFTAWHAWVAVRFLVVVPQ